MRAKFHVEVLKQEVELVTSLKNNRSLVEKFIGFTVSDDSYNINIQQAIKSLELAEKVSLNLSSSRSEAAIDASAKLKELQKKSNELIQNELMRVVDSAENVIAGLDATKKISASLVTALSIGAASSVVVGGRVLSAMFVKGTAGLTAGSLSRTMQDLSGGTILTSDLIKDNLIRTGIEVIATVTGIGVGKYVIQRQIGEGVRKVVIQAGAGGSTHGGTEELLTQVDDVLRSNKQGGFDIKSLAVSAGVGIAGGVLGRTVGNFK